MDSLAEEARAFLKSTQKGILSTFSVKYPGYPFGSVAPFVLNHQSEPILLISTIAEHTKNIQQNPNVSLVVFANEEDLQANARLTLMGTALPCPKENSVLRDRYLRFMPQASQYFDMHDFEFYRIQISSARYIAGFGRMGWIDGETFSGEDLLRTSNELTEAENSIVQHMNEDHVHNLVAYAHYVHGNNPKEALMLGIDCEGFDLSIIDEHDNKQRIRITFEHPVFNAQQAREALVNLARRAKASST